MRMPAAAGPGRDPLRGPVRRGYRAPVCVPAPVVHHVVDRTTQACGVQKHTQPEQHKLAVVPDQGGLSLG